VKFSDAQQLNELLAIMANQEVDTSKIIALRKNEAFQKLYLNIHKELEEGKGVIFLYSKLLKNIEPIQRRSLLFKFSQFVGTPIPINKAGELLREVRDMGLYDAPHMPVRGHLTNQTLPFHSDRADITVLLCESTAATGGEFKICSSASIFAVLQEYPSILEVLCQDIPHDMRDEGNLKEDVCYHPVISYHDTFAVRYIRRFINSVMRHGIVLEDKLIAALNKMDEILDDPNLCHEINLEPGHLICFNNHITLHSRNSFINNEQHQRCLLRIWLSSEFSRKLPSSFKAVFHNTCAGSFRGGVTIT
jgi:hypothetical protein